MTNESNILSAVTSSQGTPVVMDGELMPVRRFLIAGGGTGGHIFPAIAIANALKVALPNAEFLFIGANGKMEMEKIPQAGYAIKGIDIAGFNRSSVVKNLGLPFKIIKSFLQVKKIINGFKPHAVIGVGGYSTFPVLRYAQANSIPTFIHESNSFAGKANILLGKKAKAIFVATNGMEKFFKAYKIVVTGNPVRSTIATTTVSKNVALDFFKLNNTKQTVLVVGGSLGAKSINETIEQHIDFFVKNNLQLIWQTGKLFASKALEASSHYTNVYTNEFINNMDLAYAAADIVISRAGAMAITELGIVGKPSILVPYPHAAEDHQTANAQHLVNNNAAIMISDADVKVKLMDAITTLINDTALQKTFTQNIKKITTANADTTIANAIINALNN